MIRKNAIYYFTKILIDLMTYCGFVICLLVPFGVYRFGQIYDYIDSISIHLTITLFVSGLSTVYALWQIKLIFKSIFNSSPFITENVNALRKISVCSFVIAIMFIYKCFFWITLATTLLVIIFFVTGLFCLVLKDVFKQAVFFKEENDLTI